MNERKIIEMNKEILAKEVTNKIEGSTKKDIKIVVETVFETIADALVAGEKVSIPGFGTFEVADRAARKARNPQTGEEIDVPASKAPKFKAAKALKDAVKNA